MNQADRIKIKEKIISETEKIKLKINDITEFTHPVSPDNAIGRVSRMDAINNKTIFDASLRNMQERLKQLNYALDSIDNPDFGLCKKCRQTIQFERLFIRPDILVCAKCI